ncbi:Outer membrane receptor for ferrienterochelin and colicins [Bacteroidales bacterium Barb6]|nr:Outer membrane receptor for ferrienterochelin and colicins [Bacteroidales bacterium Barb6]
MLRLRFPYSIRVVLLAVLFPLAAFTQQSAIEIKGYVLEEGTREPLPGASILLEGGKTGGVTERDGSFVVRVKSLPAAVSIRFLGYKEEDVEIHEYSGPVTFFLREDAGLLDEIVVVGYGTQRRKELTGAISAIPKAVLEHVGVSFDGMLGGAVAGLNVTQTSGQPGASSSIRIRGGNSIHGGNDPLYVIDGFIFYSDNNSTKTGLGKIDGGLNPLSSINPADIESIEVLKDVSATAIYGSRGANGVIIVSTKKGKRGGDKVNYQYSIGWDKSAKKLDLMNASEWARMEKDFFNNKGKYTDDEIAALDEGYDWQDAVLRTGVRQSHELSVSGGDAKMRYLVSGNYTGQDGIVINSGFKRYNVRLNIDRDLSDKLTVGITATTGKNIQKSLTTTEKVGFNSSPYSAGITSSLTYALFMPPVVPIYSSDGGYNYKNPYEYNYLALRGNAANPVSDLENSVAETINTSLLGSFFARYTIVEGLVAKVNAGTNVSHTTQNFFAPSYTALGLAEEGIGAIGNKQHEVWLMEYTLGYTKQLNDAHYIDLLGGYTYQHSQTNGVTALTTHYTNEELKYKNIQDGSQRYAPVAASSLATLSSVIGRANYTLAGRYNLTATFRADKSSRLAKGHQWGYYPSVGLSWNINEESFLQDTKALTTLKLRLSAGTVGNQEIGDLDALESYDPQQYNGGIAYNKGNKGNSKLKWETTAQYNAGIDAGFFGDRLTLTADAYYKKTSDLFFKVPVPSSEGGGVQLENIGNVTNKGIELSLSTTLAERKNLTWTAAANIAHNVNRITHLASDDILFDERNKEVIFQVGESLGSFYGLIFDGIIQEGDDLSKLPESGTYGTPQPGDLKFRDVSGIDGKPDGKISNYDRVVLGNIQPDFTYGFSSTVNYRGFDLFVLFQGSQGNRIYNHLRRNLEHAADAYNVSAVLLDSWTSTHPSAVVPKINRNHPNALLDSRYVEDASYLRLKNITLGYKLPVRIKGLSGFRIFASAQNLLTLTGYKGYDPEVSSGIDLGVYPTARTFSAGANLSF